MKYLGIDYGAKHVGLAVSDESGTIAFPRSTIKNDEALLDAIQDFIHTEGIGSLVMGDTKSHSGKENPISAEADAFADLLQEETGLPVRRSWELWSTMEVGKYATKGHEHDDAAAAAFILQRFLDMSGKDGREV